jgi:hypothetical protein
MNCHHQTSITRLKGRYQKFFLHRYNGILVHSFRQRGDIIGYKNHFYSQNFSYPSLRRKNFCPQKPRFMVLKILSAHPFSILSDDRFKTSSKTGPQGGSGQVRKISSLPGFHPRIVQPVGIRYIYYSTRRT